MQNRADRFFSLFAAALIFCACAAQPALYVRPGSPVSPEPVGSVWLEFIAVGDFGTGDRYARAVARQIAVETERMSPLRFLLALGDNFYDDGIQGPSEAGPAFDRVIDATGYGRLMRQGRIPIYLIPGNHDHRGSVQTQREVGRRRYGDLWRHPIDSTDAYLPRLVRIPETRPVLDLVLLDSHIAIVAPEASTLTRHIAVLDSLLGVSTAPWRIVAAHHPIRSVGRHAKRGVPFSHLFSRQELNNRHYRRYAAALDSVLVRRAVHLYLAGHDHSLQVFRSRTSRGPVHILSGAGGKSSPVRPFPPDDDLLYAQQTYGFFRVTVAEGSLTCAAVDTTGKVLFSDRILIP